MKRILTIQDISCVGKCSLTVALPIISAMGVETAVIPTAVLSTHTAFKNFTFKDLTDQIEPIYKHWLDEKISFNGIYSGYLGSLTQIELVGQIFNNFSNKNCFKLVDPAMADNGKLYTGFDNNFAKQMFTLCNKADIIVPNLTEACFMLDIPYVEKGYDEQYIKDILVKLAVGNCKVAILTGVTFDQKTLGAYAYDRENNRFLSYFREYLPQSFHGTGDIFASTLCGSLARDFTIEKSLKTAVDFTVNSIKVTIDNNDHNWYGVEFERAFPQLIKDLNE